MANAFADVFSHRRTIREIENRYGTLAVFRQYTGNDRPLTNDHRRTIATPVHAKFARVHTEFY